MRDHGWIVFFMFAVPMAAIGWWEPIDTDSFVGRWVIGPFLLTVAGWMLIVGLLFRD